MAKPPSIKTEAAKTLRWIREMVNQEVQMFTNQATDIESAETWEELAAATNEMAARLIEFSGACMKEAARIRRQ